MVGKCFTLNHYYLSIGVTFGLPEDLPDQGIELHLLCLLHCRQILTTKIPGKTII